MLNTRIVRYGTGNLGITVNGIRVLLTVSGDEQSQTAEALATAIAALGPEGVPAIVLPEAPVAVERPAPRAKRFVVGQRVWCTVHAVRGWKTVIDVHKDGRIKIDGCRSWCPLHNFEEAPPAWQVGA